MTDQEALEEVLRRTRHRRFSELLDPSHPDHNPRYWLVVRRMAGQAEAAPPAPPRDLSRGIDAREKRPYPSVASMAGNAARAAVEFAAAGFGTVDQAERERRLDICRSCQEYDARQGRCRKCGCGMSLKARLASSKCPIGKW